MLCPNCKHENPDTAKFCNDCGARLTAPAAPRTDIAGPVAAPILSGQFTGPVTINPRAEPPPADWRTLYQRQLFNACNFLPLQALAPGLRASGQRLNLASLYTPLLTLTPEEHDLWTRGERDVDAHARRLSVLDLLSRHKRLLLLGDPGFGKSTFVNFVALCLSGQALGEEHINLQLLTAPVPTAKKKDEKPAPQEWQPGALLPVRVILREFAQELPAQGGSADTLWQFIARQLSAQSLGEGAASLKAELQNQGGLILLDGLDEVPEANRRRAQLIAIIEAFANAFAKCRILVTGRTYAYRAQDWQLGEFQVAVLSPFNLAQIEAFANGWYTQLAARHKLPAVPDVLAQSLLTRVRERPRLRDLAQQLLLLTFMAGLHIFSPLPERRQELYEKIVELLLNEWEQGKFTAPPGGDLRPDETAKDAPAGVPSLAQVLKVSLTDLREALEKLAFDAHQTQPAEAAHRTADLTDDQLVAALYRIKGPAGEHGDPDTLKAHLKERAGLLIEHGVDRYTFPHRTLQEYLAACHIAHLYKSKDIADMARADPDRWREVTLLAGAKLAANQESLWNLARKLCPRPVTPASPIADIWGAHLAGQLLAEAAHLEHLEADDAQTLERVTQWLAQGVLPGSLNAPERALAGRHLAQLGDPRPGVGLIRDRRGLAQADRIGLADYETRLWGSKPEHTGLPDMVWLKVEGGNITIGREKFFVQPFHIAKYPVTHTQFQAFIDDVGEGFTNPHWWEGLAADDEHKRAPGEQAFKSGNHPRERVSWYDAVAFCRWLNARLGWPDIPTKLTLKTLGAYTGLRLLTEWEWQWAATGGHPEYEYPWGPEWDSAKANTNESGLGRTTAVGMYPTGAAPCGALDMSGNVWEWCLNEYDKPTNVSLSGSAARVVRGGSWDFDSYDARAAFRGDPYPGGRNFFRGFRVCVRPPSL